MSYQYELYIVKKLYQITFTCKLRFSAITSVLFIYEAITNKTAQKYSISEKESILKSSEALSNSLSYVAVSNKNSMKIDNGL